MPIPLHTRIAELCDRRGWDMRDLAREANLSVATIRRIQHGNALRWETLARIAGALDLAPQELLRGTVLPDGTVVDQSVDPDGAVMAYLISVKGFTPGKVQAVIAFIHTLKKLEALNGSDSH